MFGRSYVTVAGKPLRIVGDGLIASVGVADGRMIPVLVVDSRDRADIEHMVEAHRHLPPGDVETQWGRPRSDKGSVGLILRFRRPVPAETMIVFNIVEQGILVDTTLSAGAFYLQPGSPGDTVSANLHAARVLVQVVTEPFTSVWEELYLKALAGDFLRRGLKGSDAKTAANEAIRLMRDLTARRLSRPAHSANKPSEEL
jgi:hypothetical protein